MNKQSHAVTTGVKTHLACALGLLLALGTAHSQTSTGATSQDSDNEGITMLSPFEVTTDADRGYYASNSITGSRISVAIQDIPLSIEVITSELIEDTGAVDLREALRYSAGIILTSQNDARNPDSFSGIGGVNNAEGVTSNKTGTSFKARGFVMEDVLREGFRRQHATDSVNIDRIEVIRGPSALLYGIGNFGGIVNYLIKKPTAEFMQDYTFGIGSNSFYRATMDISGPFKNLEGSGYRLNAAWQDNGDWTEIKKTDQFFIAPVVRFQPTRKTTITVDAEYGEQRQSGIGFQSVRSPSRDIPIVQTDRLETYGFHRLPGRDVRTFRWSGPDTFLNTTAWNMRADLQQEIVDDLFLRVGANFSKTDFDIRDVFAGLQQQVGPESLRRTVTSFQIIDGRDSDVTSEVPGTILQYSWMDRDERNRRTQYRAELTYTRRIFPESRWFSSDHTFLAGYSHEDVERRDNIITTLTEGGWNFKAPDDASPIRFGTQGDGSPDVPMAPNYNTLSDSTNKGAYFVYSGNFINDRLFLLGGVRNDKSQTRSVRNDFRNPAANFDNLSDEISVDSVQWGVSYEFVRGARIYALRSEGVQPNFGGQVDAWGNPMDAAKSRARELGMKFNLFDGKFAATVSAFQIKRSGVPVSYWWAPAPGRGAFRRGDPIIYNIADFKAAPDAPDWKEVMHRQVVMDAYANAISAGAIYDKDGNTYLNASMAAGAAYLDTVFRETPGQWPGWLYVGIPEGDPEVNSAGQDWAEGLFFQQISDSSKGFETQFLFTPNDRLQVLVNYSHVTRQIDSPGTFARYPYEEGNWDRWAMWYFPDGSWGLSGVAPDEAYPGGTGGLPNEDTSSWAGIGYGAGESLDDSPKHTISAWASYGFKEGRFSGLQLGLGGNWESRREFASSFTSSGQIKENDSGRKIQAFTDSRLTLNGMAKYSFDLANNRTGFVQLNVDNMFDDRKQYGLLYAPGIFWRFNFGLGF